MVPIIVLSGWVSDEMSLNSPDGARTIASLTETWVSTRRAVLSKQTDWGPLVRARLSAALRRELASRLLSSSSPSR